MASDGRAANPEGRVAAGGRARIAPAPGRWLPPGPPSFWKQGPWLQGEQPGGALPGPWRPGRRPWHWGGSVGPRARASKGQELSGIRDGLCAQRWPWARDPQAPTPGGQKPKGETKNQPGRQPSNDVGPRTAREQQEGPAAPRAPRRPGRAREQAESGSKLEMVFYPYLLRNFFFNVLWEFIIL